MTLLLRRLAYVCTFDDEGRELRDVDILIDGGTVMWCPTSFGEPVLPSLLTCTAARSPNPKRSPPPR
jgi:hypothetical protein